MKIENLHGNMAVLSRLSPMLKDTNSEIEDVSRLIQSDSALSASIIRISNSALYGRSNKAGNVRSALGKVGFKQALRLVGIALSREVFMRDLKVYGITADDFWCQSYFTALLMEELSRRIGLDHDDAYMVGLLHAIGKVVLNELRNPAEVDVYWDTTFTSEEWEDVMFGFHYDEAGACLLESWNFMESIYQPIGAQLSAAAQQTDLMVAALTFTKDLLVVNHYDMSVKDWVIPENHPFLNRSKSNPGIIETEIQKCRKQLAEVRKTIKGNAS